MKISVIFSVLLSMAFTAGIAQAKPIVRIPANIQTVPMTNVDTICTIDQDGMALAFGHSKNQVWYTKQGDSQGYLLQTVSYKRARCLGCYAVKAKFMGLDYALELSASGPNSSKLQGKVKGLGSSGSMEEQKIEGACKNVK
jgi:hypothetical protein